MKSKWPYVALRLDQVGTWCRSGMTEKDIAKKLGVATSTFEVYKTEHPELREVLKTNKDYTNKQVENALLKNALGYVYQEEETYKCKRVYYDDKDRRCEEEIPKTVMVTKHMPGNTTAQAIWLNNRSSDRWSRNPNKERLDRKRFEHTKSMDEKKNW